MVETPASERRRQMYSDSHNSHNERPPSPRSRHQPPTSNYAYNSSPNPNHLPSPPSHDPNMNIPVIISPLPQRMPSGTQSVENLTESSYTPPPDPKARHVPSHRNSVSNKPILKKGGTPYLGNTAVLPGSMLSPGGNENGNRNGGGGGGGGGVNVGSIIGSLSKSIRSHSRNRDRSRDRERERERSRERERDDGSVTPPSNRHLAPPVRTPIGTPRRQPHQLGTSVIGTVPLPPFPEIIPSRGGTRSRRGGCRTAGGRHVIISPLSRRWCIARHLSLL